MSVAERLDWSLGDRLAKARRYAGKEQTEMAELLGVSRALVSKWERGVTEPTVSQAQRWAEGCNVSFGWLSGSGYMLTSVPLDPGQGELDLSVRPVLASV